MAQGKSSTRRARIDRARARLAEVGVRMTPQRAAILEGIFQSDSHFSAEDLWCTLRAQGRRVSRATVYRFLSVLLRLGIVRELPLGDAHVHYEVVADGATHEHIICTVCGRIVEFTRPDIEAAIQDVCRQHGFVCQDYRFEVFGICRQCQKAQHGE